MTGLIPADNPRRALRIRRQLMAVWSYLLVWAGVLVGRELGTFDPLVPHWWLFGSVLLMNLVFFVLIRSGLSERFSEPALTVPQMLAGIVMNTFLLHWSGDLRGGLLAIYLMVMVFGVFSLSRRGMIGMSAVVMVCFTLLEAYEWHSQPEMKLFSLTIGLWSILLISLAWFVYVGGYIHNLQQRERAQRSDLRSQQQNLEEVNQQLQSAMQKLAEIAIRDELTSLYNRRHFLERLEQEMARADRLGAPLQLALIDLDHFKRINDQWGHHLGDDVLKRFARIAQDKLRRSDLIARYGGEEFVVLFNDGSPQDVDIVINRLRESLAVQVFEEQPDLSVTLSAGVTDWRPDDDADSLIRRADEALYAAKAGGRNRLVRG